MADVKKYNFSWDLIGDISVGRPYLGNLMRLEVYRLMQFTLRDILEKHYGTAEADLIFYEAGELAGKAFYENLLGDLQEFDEFIKGLQNLFQDMKIGILRVEQSDLEKGLFVLTVSEDLDCSGLPEIEYEICKYDEGFIAGLLESYSGKSFKVKEVDCWCTGDRTCRFKAEAIG
ncbi:MAG: 4-vinyl reductase [Anaerolineaceae bacterium]|nr:4-vinyl reductase [Anaerolineaceae bacterium]